MLKLDHRPRRRHAGALLAAAFAGSGLFLALPAAAQEKAPTAESPEVQRVEVRRFVKDGKVVEESNIPAEIRAKLEKFEFVGGKETDKKRSVIKLCAKPGTTKADAAKRLEEALARLETSSDIPAEHKAEVISRLKARIAELRAGG
jgi:hypothetical protein